MRCSVHAKDASNSVLHPSGMSKTLYFKCIKRATLLGRLDRETGRRKWRQTESFALQFQIFIIQDILSLYLLNPKDGEM